MNGPKIATVLADVYTAVESPARDHNQMPQSDSQICQSMIHIIGAYLSPAQYSAIVVVIEFKQGVQLKISEWSDLLEKSLCSRFGIDKLYIVSAINISNAFKTSYCETDTRPS